MFRFSLKTKMSITISILVVVLMASLSGLIITHFQGHFKESISSQQFALASEIALNIDKSVLQAQKMIVARAASFSEELVNNPAKAQFEFDEFADLVNIFDNGTFLFSRTGELLAEYPISRRQLTNFAHREYFRKTMASGKPQISEPYISSKEHHRPVVMFTAPIFGSDGAVIAVLAGSINLVGNNFFGRYADMKIGKSGYVYLYNTDRTLIMHPDKNRIMKQDEPVGVNRVFDKGLTGFEGTEENVNSRGLRALTTVKHLKSVDWILGANYPLAEAYAPVRETTQYAIIVTILGIICSVVIVWQSMKKLTVSLDRLTGHIRKISENDGEISELQINSGDEIEELAVSFSSMMKNLAGKQMKLQEISESLTRSLSETEREKIRSEAFIAAIGQMVSVQDTDFRIIYQNDVARNILGVHIGEYCYQAYHLNDSVCEGCVMLNAFQDGQVHRKEKEIFLPDGKRMYVEYTVSPVTNETGTVSAVVELVHDITEHKHMELKLSAQYAVSRILAESRTVEDAIPQILKLICESIGWDVGGIWWMDMQKDCLRLIDMWHRADLDVSSFVAMSHAMTFPAGIGLPGRVWASGCETWIPDVLQDDNYPRHQAAETSNLHSAFAIPIILGGDVVGVIEVYSRKIREYDSGLLDAIAPLGSQLGQLIDRKHAEMALGESQQQLTNIIEFLPDATLVIDKEKRVIFWNRAMEELTGVSKADILGKGDFAYSMPFYEKPGPILLDFQNIEVTELASRYQDFHQVGETLYVETYSQKLHGGQGAYLWAASTSLCDINGDRAGAIEVIRDITDRKNMEMVLEESSLAAEAANKAKSQFLASMSHEIRTPMNGVIGMASLLLSTNLDKTQREYAEIISTSGKNLLGLINDILDLSKIEAHKLELESSIFDIRAMVSNVITLLTLQAGEKGLDLKAWFDADLPKLLKGDSVRLRQVITNLIGNAIKFTPTGSVHLLISKDQEDEKTYILRFDICDSGIGIPADKLEQIFEPFTQADGSTTRRFGGTGLGLVICKQLVEMMGGELQVKSCEEKGSVFSFTVVMEKPADMEGMAVEMQQQAIGPEGSYASPSDSKLLLVEDDPVNQKVAKAFLARLGYEADMVANGIQAVEALKMYNYDLVLMDCMMPVMGGFEATAVIRDPSSTVNNHSIPVIALTASVFQEDREKCIAAGMNDYLSKPLDINELQGVLRKWLSPAGIGTAKTGDRVEAAAVKELIDVFDVERFVKRNLDDRELSREVAIIFLNSGEEYIASICHAIFDRDCSELRQHAHKLRGAAANFSLTKLCETAETIETIAVSGDAGKAEELVTELEQRFEQAAEALRNLLILPGGDHGYQ